MFRFSRRVSLLAFTLALKLIGFFLLLEKLLYSNTIKWQKKSASFFRGVTFLHTGSNLTPGSVEPFM